MTEAEQLAKTARAALAQVRASKIMNEPASDGVREAEMDAEPAAAPADLPEDDEESVPEVEEEDESADIDAEENGAEESDSLVDEMERLDMAEQEMQEPTASPAVEPSATQEQPKPAPLVKARSRKKSDSTKGAVSASTAPTKAAKKKRRKRHPLTSQLVDADVVAAYNDFRKGSLSFEEYKSVVLEHNCEANVGLEQDDAAGATAPTPAAPKKARRATDAAKARAKARAKADREEKRAAKRAARQIPNPGKGGVFGKGDIAQRPKRGGVIPPPKRDGAGGFPRGPSHRRTLEAMADFITKFEAARDAFVSNEAFFRDKTPAAGTTMDTPSMSEEKSFDNVDDEAWDTELDEMIATTPVKPRRKGVKRPRAQEAKKGGKTPKKRPSRVASPVGTEAPPSAAPRGGVWARRTPRVVYA